MKQGLSLRVSQHLALTPQLQQSIRLLQLSTLEMAQEVEQMLDENPFLERGEEVADREDFGVQTADAPVVAGEQLEEAAQPVVESRSAEPDTRTTQADSADSSSDDVESRLDGAAPVPAPVRRGQRGVVLPDRIAQRRRLPGRQPDRAGARLLAPDRRPAGRRRTAFR